MLTIKTMIVRMLTVDNLPFLGCCKYMDQQISPFGLQRETLATSVRSEIARRILAGQLAAGEKLNEVALAQALAVSRGTVREAIRSLADSGLIDLIANRGAFVRRLTVDEIKNLYDLRGAIFALGCASVARRMQHAYDPELVDRFKQNLEEMRLAHSADDFSSYYELNIAFHDLMLDAAQNSKAKKIYDQLVKEMHLFRRRGLSIAMNIARSIDEHLAIVDAVAAGEISRAREAGQIHIESGLERFLKTLAEPQPSEINDQDLIDRREKKLHRNS